MTVPRNDRLASGVMDLLTKETLEQLEELLTELRENASSGTPIIVEGADDVEALRKLGVNGHIHKISGGNSLLNFIEGFSGSKEVIILTDFDRTGDKLAGFFTKHLRQLGVKPIIEFRDKLKSLVRKEVKDIEGLARFVQKQRTLVKD